MLHGASFLSESAFRELTGIEVDLAPGTGANILDDQASTPWRSAGDVTHITNMVTGQEMDIQPVEPVRYTQLLGCFLLDDGDYAAITQGLTPEWREEFVAFQVADLEASYPFASDLFYAIVDHSGPEVEVVSAWDPVERMLQLQEKGRTSMTQRHWRNGAMTPFTIPTQTAPSSERTGNTCHSLPFWTRRNWSKPWQFSSCSSFSSHWCVLRPLW